MTQSLTDNVMSPAACGNLLYSLASWWVRGGAANQRNSFSPVPSLNSPCFPGWGAREGSRFQTLAADEDSTPWVVSPGH